MSNANKEVNPARLRALAERARRLAGGVQNAVAQAQLNAAAAEYEQRAKEVEMDDITGQ